MACDCKIEGVGLSLIGDVVQDSLSFNGFSINSTATGFSDEELGYRYTTRTWDVEVSLATDSGDPNIPPDTQDISRTQVYKYPSVFGSSGGDIAFLQADGVETTVRHGWGNFLNCGGDREDYARRITTDVITYYGAGLSSAYISSDTNRTVKEFSKSADGRGTSSCSIVFETGGVTVTDFIETGQGIIVEDTMHYTFKPGVRVGPAIHETTIIPHDGVTNVGYYRRTWSELIDYDYALAARAEALSLIATDEETSGWTGTHNYVPDEVWVNGLEYGECGGVKKSYKLLSKYEVIFDDSFSTMDVDVTSVRVRHVSNVKLRLGISEVYGVPAHLWLRGELIYVSQDDGVEPVITSFSSKVSLVSSGDLNEYNAPEEWNEALEAPVGGGAWYVSGSYQLQLGGYKYQL